MRKFWKNTRRKEVAENGSRQNKFSVSVRRFILGDLSKEIIAGMRENSNKYLLVLILLHLAIALPLAFFLNIWADEASTLYSTQNGFFHAFGNAWIDEKQAPLYFWSLSLWRNLNDSIFFARIFSTVCSCLAIKVFYNLARRLFDENAALFVTAFFALHPLLFWASAEIRVYSLVILFSCLLLKSFADAFLNSALAQNQKTSKIIYVVISIIALYTNYYLGFLLVGNFAALLILRKWREAKNYFLLMIIVGAAILPMAWIIKQQLEINTGGMIFKVSFIEAAQILWNHLLTFVLPTELFPGIETSIVSIVRNWLVRLSILAAIFFLVKNKFRAIDEKVLTFGAISATVIVFLIAAYFILGNEYISLRHAALLFPPVILLVYSFLLNALPRKSWIIFAVLLAFLFPFSIYKLYPTRAKRGDWARVGAFIEQREKPNQPIIIYKVYDALNLPYHYAGVNKIYPDKGFFEWNAEDSAISENRFKRQIDFIISQIPPEAEEIWLLTAEDCQNPNLQIVCLPLENFVEANYTIELEKDFYLERVRLLKKKQK